MCTHTSHHQPLPSACEAAMEDYQAPDSEADAEPAKKRRKAREAGA